jgi:hypothetical protein
MRLTFVLLGLVLMGYSGKAQQPIQINKADLPSAGDTFRMSVAANPQSINIQKTGANKSWNFSNLTPTTQYVDTYRSLSSLPSIYGLLSFQKNVDFGRLEGALLENLPMSDQLPIDEVYSFYNKDGGTYEQVAFGISILGQDVPAPFQNNDEVYKLPLTYQQKDSSTAFVNFPPSNIPIPDTFDFYFEESRKRTNHVDAWGTLTTPFGTFETLRVRTVVEREDSVSIQGLNQGIEPPDQVLFRWLTKDGGNPILQVRAQRVAGQVVVSNAIYQDSARNLGGGPPTSIQKEEEASPFKVYPNPADEHLHLSLPGKQTVSYQVYNMHGKSMLRGTKSIRNQQPGTIAIGELESGMYVIKLGNKAGESFHHSRFLVN